MQENNITRIKNHQSKVREKLVQLANHAYSLAKSDANSNPLNFERDQAEKYNRFQFVFDPTQGFEEQRQLFNDVFGDDAEDVFEQLKAEHPFGVEIWVNPKNCSKHLLAERQGFLAAASILDGAQRLLEDLFEEQKRFINTYYNIAEEERQNTRLLIKEARILETIQEEYKHTIAIINASYNATFAAAEREKQFKQIKKAVKHFQLFAIAQLTAFKMADGQKPSDKDFTNVYELLNSAEQNKSYTNHSAAENIFNRDILTIDVQSEINNQVQISDTHFHKRHYSLTEAQVDIKKSTKPNLQIDAIQPTATSHNTDYLLGNSALVEEGSYTHTSAPQLKINLLDARHSSPAPSQMYDQNSVDRHETTYRTFLNMEQHLQQLRTITIANILGQNVSDLSSAQIKDLSTAISLKLTSALHISELTPSEFISAIRETVPDVRDDIVEALSNHYNSIIGIKSIHTHLITASGPGSHFKNQQYQFEDARLAQYATWHADAGYIYMANGVNTARYFDGKTKAHGCNAVVLVELFKKFHSSFQFQISFSFNEYERQLRKIQNSSREYLAQTEKYLYNKFKHDHLQNEIKSLRADLAKLKQLAFDATTTNRLETTIKDKEAELKKQNSDVDTDSTLLMTKRKNLEKEEENLFKIAIALNKQIHTTLNSLNSESTNKLTLKAFRLIEMLFNETNGLGIKKWKLSKNNGLMQALIHLTAQLVGIFSSGGCRSANNRETLLAMLVTELSKLVDGSTELNEEYLSSLSKQVQDFYPTHISNEQTALDHCALPNAGIELSSDISEDESTNLTEPSTDPQIEIAQEQPKETQKEILKVKRQAENKEKQISDMDKYGTPDGFMVVERSSFYLRKEAEERKKPIDIPQSKFIHSDWEDLTPEAQAKKIQQLYQQHLDAKKAAQQKQMFETIITPEEATQNFRAKTNDTTPTHRKEITQPVQQNAVQLTAKASTKKATVKPEAKMSVTKERSWYASLAAHLRAHEQSKKPLNTAKLHQLAINDEIYQWWEQQSRRSNMNKITEKLYLFVQEQGEIDLEGKKAALREVQNEIDSWTKQSIIPTNVVRKLQNKLECRMFRLDAEQQKLTQANLTSIEETNHYKNLKQYIDQIYALSQTIEGNHGEGWKQIKTIYQSYNFVDPSLEDLLIILEQLRDIAATRYDDLTSCFARWSIFNAFTSSEKRPEWLRQLYSSLRLNPINHPVADGWIQNNDSSSALFKKIEPAVEAFNLSEKIDNARSKANINQVQIIKVLDADDTAPEQPAAAQAFSN